MQSRNFKSPEFSSELNLEDRPSGPLHSVIRLPTILQLEALAVNISTQFVSSINIDEISSGVEEDLGREKEREERIPLKREQQDRQNIVMALRSVAGGFHC